MAVAQNNLKFVLTHIPDADCLRNGDLFSSFTLLNPCHGHSDPLPCERGSITAARSLHEQNRVAVILGYYNGQVHVAEQLQSIFKQSHQALHVFVSDDRSAMPLSADALSLGSEQLARLSVGSRTENMGFAHNFLNALASIDGSFEYFAFSDQDDVWRPDKLEKAIKALSKVSTSLPVLYCARTEIVDDGCEHTLGYSPRFRKPPCFANALVQNIGGGNTMVFNRAARELIVASVFNVTVVSHDWWCYQIVTGAGGYVVYDPEPCLKYRQHSNNLVGKNNSWGARFLRILGLLQGRFRVWNDINLEALSKHKSLLTTQNQRRLETFMQARQPHFFKRLLLFKRSGVYRQTLLGTLGLLLGILLNKV